jgi:hypothetical protein
MSGIPYDIFVGNLNIDTLLCLWTGRGVRARCDLTLSHLSNARARFGVRGASGLSFSVYSSAKYDKGRSGRVGTRCAIKIHINVMLIGCFLSYLPFQYFLFRQTY